MKNQKFSDNLWSIVKLRKEGKTLNDIAEIYNCSRERVRQLLKQNGYWLNDKEDT